MYKIYIRTILANLNILIGCKLYYNSKDHTTLFYYNQYFVYSNPKTFFTKCILMYHYNF